MKKEVEDLYIAVSDLLLAVYNRKPISSFTEEVDALYLAQLKSRPYFRDEVINTLERLRNEKHI